MKKKTIQIFCSAFFLVLNLLTAFAQSATVTAGGTATGSGGILTYTVGQIADQKAEGNGQHIIEGVQQPYEIQTVGVDNYPNISLNAMVYPNPTVGNVSLKITGMDVVGEVKVFDVNGKYLFSKEIEGEITDISLSSLTQGTYFVNVYDKQRMLMSFKVVKIHN
jgi:hypothetical protein